MQEIRFAIWLLHSIQGISYRQKHLVYQRFSWKQNKQLHLDDLIYYSEATPKQQKRLRESYDQLTMFGYPQAQQAFIAIFDEEYPEMLREIYQAPLLLYYQGDLSLLENEKIAIVGSRNPEGAALQATRQITTELVSEAVTIVSGLARGIDTQAHRTALVQQGKTIAVLGTGLDRVYPPENAQLQRFLQNQHLVVSEYPLGTAPYRAHFPQRNRIIAGLSRGICVVQAAIKSGSLITAEFALENNRDVYVVPGSSVNDSSTGSHLLLQQGAKCVWQGSHIIEEIRPFLSQTRTTKKEK